MAPDQRFARLASDPRFRRPKQKAIKAEIDERFKDVLSEDFGKEKGKARVDKRGRVISSTSGADEMKRFYRLKSPVEEEEHRIDYARGEGALESSGSEDEGSDNDESEVEEEELEIGGKRKLHTFVPSDSDKDEDSDDEHLRVNLSEDESESLFPPEADQDDEEEEEGVDPTTRIAVVNLDWDNMRAHDLFTIFNSFLKPLPRKGDKSTPPPVGKLINVRIYPSEFGKERMALEDAAGPGGGIFKVQPGDKKKKEHKRTERFKLAGHDSEEDDEDEEEEDNGKDEDEDEDDNDDDDEDEDEEGNADPTELSDDGLDPVADNLEILDDISEVGSDDVDMEKLRQYQLERLRYYYAIATFSTVEAAELVHDELNGTEFERTANILDLSYVPDGMTFEEDDLHDECTKEPKAYKGNEFVTDALRHSKVKLTWDQDDPNRAKITRRALTREEIEEEDFGNLVAASSDSESESEVEGAAADTKAAKKSKSKKERMKERKEKLRALLLADDNDTGDIWGKAGSAWQDELADLKGQVNKDKEEVEITFRPGLTMAADDENLTSLERYQMRMKEKKAKKKEKMELKREGTDEKDKKDKKGSDDFFGDSDSNDDEPSRKRARSPSVGPVDMDDPAGLVEDQSHHFSLKDHVAAEKDNGKKRKRSRKSKKGKDDREQELGPEGFKVDVADPRFSAMYDEPTFALDPTHPKYHDIQANRDILKTTRERHASKRGAGGASGEAAGEKDLSSLVESVKAKMGGHKRKRSRKH